MRRKGLELALGYRFGDVDQLRQALQHRSWVGETGEGPSNERLEFLGDTILQFVVTDFVYAHYPEYPPGDIAMLRSSVVRNEVLFEVAREVGLGGYLRLGKGEESTGGREKSSILADAMEAVLGAVFLDGGLEAARSLILRLWEERIRKGAAAPGWKDYKSRLQEYLAREGDRPVYRITEKGPDHDKSFSAVLSVNGVDWGEGTGLTKREAQQVAASRALEALEPGTDKPCA